MEGKDAVQRQFGRSASGYATSAVHVGGPDLAAMLTAAALTGTEAVLDVGTGTGHTALAFAPAVARVVALDLTAAMLSQGRRLAAERGIENISFEQGDAEALPYPDAAFDVVTCRYCAHHFPRPAVAAQEMARVLRAGGRLLLVDTVGPNTPTTDTYLNAVEVLRDPSHVRDHAVAAWQDMFAAAGLTLREVARWPLRLAFADWVARMAVPPATVEQIRALLDIAPVEVRAALQVEPDHSFNIPVALLVGRRPGE